MTESERALVGKKERDTHSFRKSPWFRRLFFVGLGLCVLVFVVWPLVWQIGFGMPGYADFYLHRAKYENIVRTVKTLPLASGATTQLTISGIPVSAARLTNGQYQISLMTLDWDHAGSYGYLFADAPPKRVTDDDYREINAPGDLPFVDRQINRHWWSVYTNLN